LYQSTGVACLHRRAVSEQMLVASIAPPVYGDKIEVSCVRVRLRETARHQVWQRPFEFSNRFAEPAGSYFTRHIAPGETSQSC
jgi:hypothetical protein